MYWQLYYLRLCGSISCKKNGIKYPLLGATDEPEEGNQRLKIIINLSSNAKLETQQLPWQQIKGLTFCRQRTKKREDQAEAQVPDYMSRRVAEKVNSTSCRV